MKGDIADLDKQLGKKIDDVDKKLSKKIDNLSSKVDQNSLCFMTNLDSVDKRVAKLEAVC